MKINDLVKISHQIAKEKGWWNPPKSDVECHMLMVTEIAEATEACRHDDQLHFFFGKDNKPEGEAVELVDAIIRIADYFGSKGWDMEEIISAKIKYNKTRSHRHGNKKY